MAFSRHERNQRSSEKLGSAGDGGASSASAPPVGRGGSGKRRLRLLVEGWHSCTRLHSHEGASLLRRLSFPISFPMEDAKLIESLREEVESLTTKLRTSRKEVTRLRKAQAQQEKQASEMLADEFEIVVYEEVPAVVAGYPWDVMVLHVLSSSHWDEYYPHHRK